MREKQSSDSCQSCVKYAFVTLAGAVWTFPLMEKEDAFIQEWQTQPETDLLCFLETAVYVRPLQARAKLWGL